MIHLLAHVPTNELHSMLITGVILGVPAGACIAAWWADRRRDR